MRITARHSTFEYVEIRMLSRYLLRPTLPATSLNGRKPLRAAQTALRVASPVPERVREKIELYALWAIWVSTRSRPVALA